MSLTPDRTLDWNELWREAAARRWPDLRERAKYWDKRAPSFARRGPSLYARTFVGLMAPQPHWSVLDVGCGTGTLAIPLAPLVARVTAMDFSRAMIERLLRDCREAGIQNVRALHAGWEDDWDAAGIGVHDVAIASRSLVVEDLEAAIRKLDRAARRRVCIVAPAGDGPLDRRTVEAVGRPFRRNPDYIYVYNLLHQMGIHADVTMIKVEDERAFGSQEEALAFYRMLLEDLDGAEEARLRTYLSEQLVGQDGKWRLPGADVGRWALIQWEKEELRPDARG